MKSVEGSKEEVLFGDLSLSFNGVESAKLDLLFS